MMQSNSLIVIPTRLAATRLPNKPLKMVGEKPLICHVVDNALKTTLDKILVACGDQEIITCVEKHFRNNERVSCLLTDPKLPSGTDRVIAAVKQYDTQQKYKFIINLQGDLPIVDKSLIHACNDLIQGEEYEMSTVAQKIIDPTLAEDSNTVKIAISFKDSNSGKALYFSRAKIPYGALEYYHHMGIYGYKRSLINRWEELSPSILEQYENLEQLRALENNISIGVKIVNKQAIEVNTQEDLDKILSYGKK